MSRITRAACRWYVRRFLAPALAAGAPVPWARRRIERATRLAGAFHGARIVRTEIAGRPAEWVRAKNVPADSDAAVLYLHGGGFIVGSPRTHRGVAAALSRECALPVLVPDYRLAPEHPFPTPEDDCLAVYRALIDDGCQARRLAVGGESAGGFLTLQLLLALRDHGMPQPGAAFVLSPIAELRRFDGESYMTRRELDIFLDLPVIRELVDAHLGGAERDTDDHSPIHRDLTGLPPLLIQVGDHEVLLSDSTRLADRARACGVDTTLTIWPQMWHAFQLFGTLEPEARRAVREIGDFLRDGLGLPGGRMESTAARPARAGKASGAVPQAHGSRE